VKIHIHMVQEQTNTTQEQETTKNVWNTVTPLSKTLALVLFIALPCIGFYFGYRYASEGVAVVESVDLKSIESTQTTKKVPSNETDLGDGDGYPREEILIYEDDFVKVSDVGDAMLAVYEPYGFQFRYEKSLEPPSSHGYGLMGIESKLDSNDFFDQYGFEGMWIYVDTKFEFGEGLDEFTGQKMSLDEFISTFLAQSSTPYYFQQEVVSSEDMSVGDMPAKQVVFSVSMEGVYAYEVLATFIEGSDFFYVLRNKSAGPDLPASAVSEKATDFQNKILATFEFFEPVGEPFSGY